jgi:hypothetical protein
VKTFGLVALISTYAEGTLAQGAVDSCQVDGIDEVFVLEGPCADPLFGVPATELHAGWYTFDSGSWGTDAEKRTQLLRWAVDDRPEPGQGKPLWGFWLDGDEILMNGRYLADLVQSVQWQNELLEERGEQGFSGMPLHIFDQDGSVATDRVRVMRIDQVDEILVSNLIYRMSSGVEVRLGRDPVTVDDLIQTKALRLLEAQEPSEKRDAEIERLSDLLIFPMPLPCEPYIYHRPHLRHPRRAALRLHEQEHDELVRLGLPTGD